MGAESFVSAAGPSELEGASPPRAGEATSQATGLPRKLCVPDVSLVCFGIPVRSCALRLLALHECVLNTVAQLGLKLEHSCSAAVEV